MAFLEPANYIAKRLKDIHLSPLVRPPLKPDDASTQELVTWSVQSYVYSSIAHYRTILDGLITLAATGNQPTMCLVYRHLYEWTMHGCFMHQSLKKFLDAGDLNGAWELFLQADTANGWVRQHGAKYLPVVAGDEIPNSIRIKRLVAAYEKHQQQQRGTDDVQDSYGYLSEHSHPNGACFLDYRVLDFSVWQISFREAPVDTRIRGVAHAATADWLMTIYELLSMVNETSVRPHIVAILKEIAALHTDQSAA